MKVAEPSINAVLLAVVDIVNLHSTLLICGRVEASLALAAYGGELTADGSMLQLAGLVSRKKDFVPPLTKAVKEGWEPPQLSVEIGSALDLNGLHRTKSMLDVPHGEVSVEYTDDVPSGLLVRRDD